MSVASRFRDSSSLAFRLAQLYLYQQPKSDASRPPLAPPVSRPRHPPLLARSASLLASANALYPTPSGPKNTASTTDPPTRRRSSTVHPSWRPSNGANRSRREAYSSGIAAMGPRAYNTSTPSPAAATSARRLPGELRSAALDVEERRRVGTRADARERCCSRLCPRRWRRSRGCRRRRRGCLVRRPGLPRASQTPRRTRPSVTAMVTTSSRPVPPVASRTCLSQVR